MRVQREQNTVNGPSFRITRREKGTSRDHHKKSQQQQAQGTPVSLLEDCHTCSEETERLSLVLSITLLVFVHFIHKCRIVDGCF